MQRITTLLGIAGEPGIMERIFGNQTTDDGGTTTIEAPPVVKPDDKVEPEKPAMYAIVLHNDNSTTPQFVTRVLSECMSIERQKAQQIMMSVHLGERGVVKIVSKEIAETQVANAGRLIAAAEANRDFVTFGGRVPRCELTFTVEIESGSDK